MNRKEARKQKEELRQKGEALKAKLKQEHPRRYLTSFYETELIDVDISYFHFCNILRGRYDRERKDVIDVVNTYLSTEVT